MKILLASSNKNKIKEIRGILAKASDEEVEVLSLADVNFHDEIVEDGGSFEENALIKARTAASLGYFGIGDDSGLCVDALDGAPGIYSARYAGEPCDDEKNNRKLLAALESCPDEKRTARFVCTLACVSPDGDFFTVRGECEGVILRTPFGEGGFGYDPLFRPVGFDKTFSELSFEEKNAISHRGRALSAFAEAFSAFVRAKVVCRRKNNPN